MVWELELQEEYRLRVCEGVRLSIWGWVSDISVCPFAAMPSRLSLSWCAKFGVAMEK